jgi:pyruvate dehydrogenase E1 component beta subunit
MGVGAAMVGLRPIIEWMTVNFALMAYDQVVSNVSKTRYMSGGQFEFPVVMRGPNGPAEYLGAQHSQALQTIFAHVPGLKVVSPSTPYDAKGLLKTSIRDNNPVVFLEGELMYAWKGEVPEEEYLIPLGKADVKREGSDLTLVSYGKPMRVTLEAAEKLASMGLEAEVVDPRSIRPLDEETVYASVRKTHRCVIVEESWPFASVGAHVAWLISRNAFDYLDAPVEMVASADVPMPYNHRLELAAQPQRDTIVEAAKRVLYME